MASLIVSVLKGPSGKNGVRLAMDYRFVNLHLQGDAFVMPHLLDSIQKVTLTSVLHNNFLSIMYACRNNKDFLLTGNDVMVFPC